MSPTLEPNVLAVVGVAFGALTVGSVVRLLFLRGVDDPEVARRRLDSLKSWWGVAVAVGGAALLGRTAAVLLFAGVSVFGYREFLRLTPGRRWRGGYLLEGVLLIGSHYALIWLGLRDAVAVFLPVAALVWISARVTIVGHRRDMLRATADLVWGLLLTAYALSHAVWFFSLDGVAANPVAGPAGWFLFLVLLAETNDIFQALVGRSIGRRRIAPRLSPHKTWEGFLGGLTTTVLLAVVAGRWLAPLGPAHSAAAGLLVAPAGLVGDLTISALKRRAGVKDSGTALPGQGGVLDRADSLLVSAPLYFYFVLLLS